MKRSGLKVMLKLVGLVRPLAGFMALAILLGLLGQLCATAITVIGGQAVLRILHPEWSMSVAPLFVACIVCGFARGFLRYGEQTCNHYIAFKLLALIRDKVFGALRRLTPAKLEGRDRGNLITVITSDVELLEVFYAHTISPICIATLFGVVLVGFIGAHHWALGVLALVAYVTVGVILPLATSKASGSEGAAFRSASGDLATFVLDSLRGLPQILQYGCGDARMAELERRSAGLSAHEERLKRVAARNNALTGAVILLFDLCMLGASAALLGFDGCLICTLALMSSFGPFVALSALGSTLQQTFAAGNRVLDILEEEPLVCDITGEAPCGTFTGAGLEEVTFAYGDETVLRDVNMAIPQGRILGIQGPSGSGKSTICKLLMRFWEAGSGRVSVSGRDINRINTNDLRDLESYVTQETHLFHDSIAANLRIAKPDATPAQLEEACRKASVHDFIMSLPQGYDTPVGELGETLSGGERQRLGLARAFLREAPFMLLDEPTSNLDSLNEAMVLKALAEGRGERTVVLVSHRASTMGIADEVYRMDSGRVS